MISFSYSISQILGYRFIPKWPIITAIVLILTSRRFYGNGANTLPSLRSESRKRVFFLPKTLFKEDLVRVFLADDPEFELWYVSRQPLAVLAEWFLPSNLNEYDYQSESVEVSIKKEALRAHWLAALHIFIKIMQPRAFLTCAYYYRDQREFAAASVAVGIPFIALHKECITTPVTRAVREEIYGLYSGPFMGSFITTYNDEEKTTMVRSGAAAMEKVEVVGCPRMDPLFHPAKQEFDEQSFDIVFFSFSRTTYLPVYRRIPKWPSEIQGVPIYPWNWNQLYQEFHLFAIDFARHHPSLRIALKVKVGFNVEDILKAQESSKLGPPPNLQIIRSGAGGSLAASASVVCGFNSTVLIEALAARTPVIVPAFAEAELGTIAEQFGTLRLGNAVSYARSACELTAMLEERSSQRPERTRPHTNDERLVIERYVGFADGHAGERMRQSIASAISSFRQPAEKNN